MLEAMNDRQVSVEKNTHYLPRPFMLLATQNPVEFSGTFPLPESQLDRFTMAIRMGYPDTTHELEIIRSSSAELQPSSLAPVLDTDEVLEMQDLAEKVRVEEDLVSYILAIAQATRNHDGVSLGVSPRGTRTLFRTAQALALAKGREYCIPDDIKALAVPVFAHRIIPASRGIEDVAEDGVAVIEEILSAISVPV
jgi:MoxR-like ATPase